MFSKVIMFDTNYKIITKCVCKHCGSDSNKEPLVTWFNKGDFDEKIEICEKDSSLKIEYIDHYTETEYACVGVDPHGLVAKVIRFNVCQHCK